jgi:ABC-type bacteriocin/lantibiotic exporter with double-glycine peptidase domain
MIAEHYGKQYALEHLRDNCFIGREGVSMLGIGKAAEKIGFHTVGGRLTFDKPAEKALLPCLTHVRKLLMETTGVCSLYLVLHPSSMTLNSNEWGSVPKSAISSISSISSTEDIEDFNSEQMPAFSESVTDLLSSLLSQIVAKAVLQSLSFFIPSTLCILSISPLFSRPHLLIGVPDLRKERAAGQHRGYDIFLFDDLPPYIQNYRNGNS